MARTLADKAETLWSANGTREEHDSINPFEYTRRLTTDLKLTDSCRCGAAHPPRVIIPLAHPPSDGDRIKAILSDVCSRLRETRIEGLLLPLPTARELTHIDNLISILADDVDFLVVNLSQTITTDDIAVLEGKSGLVLLRAFEDSDTLIEWATFCSSKKLTLALDCSPDILEIAAADLDSTALSQFIFTRSGPPGGRHAVGDYLQLVEILRKHTINAPVWIRATETNRASHEDYFSSRLLDHSILTGSLLCDGIGDLSSVETEDDPHAATGLAWNVLQGAKARISRTEYVACPSCGRTLFDLQSTTQKIRSRTGHLKNVTIAIMGCIVNGPGEMADADFGYVGGAPGKVNLYVGKECVKKNIQEDEAVERLIDLLREHPRWREPALENT